MLEFARETGHRRIHDRVMVTSCGCFGPCESGPNVIMYPDGTLYTGVHPEDVSELIECHVLGGKIVERLVAPGW
jgi:(2Fe-2S) ferredoxin